MDPVNVQAKFELRGFTRSWDNSGYLKTFGSLWIRISRSSKVADFGTNRKRVCDFLLVRHSNLAPFRRYCRFFCAPGWPHPYSTLILGVFPLHQIAYVGVSPSPKLFCREIIFEVFQPVWKSYLNVTDGQTYRQTDRQTDRQTECQTARRFTVA